MQAAYQIAKPTTQHSSSISWSQAVMAASIVVMPAISFGHAAKVNPFEEYDCGDEATTIINKISDLSRANLRQKLDLIAKLPADWDGYGAPAISKDAIAKCRSLIQSLSDDIMIDLTVKPTEFGGVRLSYNNPVKNFKMSVEFGDNAMSYYVVQGDLAPQFVSFVAYDETTLHKLKSTFEKSIA